MRNLPSQATLSSPAFSGSLLLDVDGLRLGLGVATSTKSATALCHVGEREEVLTILLVKIEREYPSVLYDGSWLNMWD
jgi:hypothetical protein